MVSVIFGVNLHYNFLLKKFDDDDDDGIFP